MSRKPVLSPLDLRNGETIGQRIAKIRKKLGLTQDELGQKIGIKRSMVSDYEIGRAKLYDDMIARFAITLEVSTDYLIGLTDNTELLSKMKEP